MSNPINGWDVETPREYLIDITHDITWLVVWNMVFMTFHSVGNFIIPTDEIHHFQRGRYTTNQLFMIDQIRLTTVGFTVDISDGAIN